MKIRCLGSPLPTLVSQRSLWMLQRTSGLDLVLSKLSCGPSTIIIGFGYNPLFKCFFLTDQPTENWRRDRRPPHTLDCTGTRFRDAPKRCGGAEAPDWIDPVCHYFSLGLSAEFLPASLRTLRDNGSHPPMRPLKLYSGFSQTCKRLFSTIRLVHTTTLLQMLT